MPEVRGGTRSVGELLSEVFSGEWGRESRQVGFERALVAKSTEISDDGQLELSTAVERFFPIDKIKKKALRNNDILVEAAGGSPTRPVGRPAIVKLERGHPPVLSSNFVKALRFDEEKLVHRYAIHALRHLYLQPRFSVTQQKTTGIINLKFSELEKLRIWVPTETCEQNLLADILDAMDEAINQTETLIKKLGSIHQGLLHDLLTLGIDGNGEIRRPEASSQFRTALGFLPVSWSAEPLGKLANDLVLGTSARGATDGKPKLRLLKMGNLGWDTLDTASCELIDMDRVVRWKVASLRDGDLLFNTRNTPELVGKTAAYDQSDGHTVADNNILRVRFREDRMDGRFAAAYMANGLGKARLMSLATGTTSVAAIYWRDLKDFLLPVPPREERQEIVRRLQASRDRTQRERDKVEKLRALRDGLRDDLLTGRVPVVEVREAAE